MKVCTNPLPKGDTALSNHNLKIAHVENQYHTLQPELHQTASDMISSDLSKHSRFWILEYLVWTVNDAEKSNMIKVL